ncbi:Piwi domain-containing protein [Sphingobacterium psychroaquaticum]|uniref:Protein argonaute n=1 Tax=Sphingobacterium psychroaquaticum TaxID=561061 RepID=A0A1X7IML5_9SPHI|nr:Piwi domain-containing protein [Sphingobacterium psychroaquaticum]SMG15595.1 Piwi domain-containing protein [Sphingobacterium psychroaquaticum]
MQLNYFPINFEFDEYQIKTEPYSEDRLSELRELHNTTHSFFRNGENIYISNKEGEDISLIGSVVSRSVFEDSQVTASLIKHLFFRTFKDRFPNYIPVDFYPFRFFSAQAKDDIIYKVLPENLKKRVAYKKLIEVQLRLTEINGKKQFGFLINIKRNWIFNKSCAELHSEGYNLLGVDVLHTETIPGLADVLAPNEELLGVITEIADSKAKIETNEGIKEYPLEQLFIKKSKYNIGNYLSFAISQQKSDEIMNLIESKRADIYNTKALYDEILKISKHLFCENGSSILFHNKDGFCFKVDDTPLTVSNSIDLKMPTFIFDPAATKTNSSSPDLGLSNYGPYDSSIFDIKSPNVLCICNRNNRGNFTKFLSNLKDGIPQSRYFQKGLQKKYDLQDVILNVRELQAYSIDDYLNVISGYDENKPHLAIIEIPASFKRQADIANPYYRIKAKLLSLEIPVQFVTSEIIGSHNEYILNSIALQIYAKLGGTPWVLPSQRSVDKEIIIGIGHSWLRKNQYAGAEQNRVVGITTFMSSDGQYLLGDKVKDVPFENYFEELLKSLKQSIQRLSTEQGWSDGDTVRLIFHIFKPIKNTEFDVISQLVRDITQYKIKFAFVTISTIHPTMLFDANQPGVSKYRSNIVKGQYIPNRGSNVFLDDRTSIVQMFGANELKTAKQGMSKPILINIRTPQGNYSSSDLNDLLFYDLGYITQQIFSFTYLSWRSFLPGEEPATMKYSNLISKLLGKMRNIPNWDADNLNYGLKRKKWFL